MKKIGNITIGGLQHKIYGLVRIFMILTVALYIGAAFYQEKSLEKIVTDANRDTKKGITNISNNTMDLVVTTGITQDTTLEASYTDSVFSNVRGYVVTLQTMVQNLYEHQDSYPLHEYYEPDMSKDGESTVQFLHEEGVDLNNKKVKNNIGLIANASSEMLSILDNNDSINTCFVATTDGTFLIADDKSATKFDGDGNINAFPVRQRPWYKEAVKKKDVVFSDLEIDTFTSKLGLVVSAPVYCDGKLVGVVGVDVFLDTLKEAIAASASEGAFLCILNHEGQVIFSPKEDGIFEATLSQDAVDLRESEDASLAGYISKALEGYKDVTVIEAEGREYYVAAEGIKTVGWTLINVVDKEMAMFSTTQMIDSYEETVETASEEQNQKARLSFITVLIMTIVLFILGTIGSLALS
ncbi:MAG: cache domain-containing protein, partial [Lachnospiraceae bacterium]|nr:cache domain-containing protein [Lachnospiraceae bacterium]